MRWAGQDLKFLIELPVDELRILYPEQTIKNLKRRKQEYLKKARAIVERPASGEQERDDELDRLAAAFKDAGLNFSKDDLSKADRAGFHVGYIRNADGEIEYTKPLPHVDFGRGNGNKTSAVNLEPVTAAIIRPSRIKPLNRDHKVLFVMSDAQIGYRRIGDELRPIHDERAIASALQLAKDLNPDIVVDCGDTVDFAELSRHPIDSDHFQNTLQPSLQRTHELFAEFTSVTPNAEKRVTVDSNHVKRLGDYVLRNAFPLYGVKAADEMYPALSYPGLLKLDKVGWDFIGGYHNAEYEYADDLAFIHGTFAVSGGSTASKLARANHDRNIIQGHKHSMESHFHTDRRGRYFGAFVVGALCRIDGVVPSYHSAIDQFNQPVQRYENWQNGVMVIKDYGGGNYQFDQVAIRNGIINYNGKTYDGTEGRKVL